MNLFKVPGKKKRIVMVTPDTLIDRRILLEAESLQSEGYEVYILSVQLPGEKESSFEVVNGIKIERVAYDGSHLKLTKPAAFRNISSVIIAKIFYKIQFLIFKVLNKISNNNEGRFWNLRNFITINTGRAVRVTHRIINKLFDVFARIVMKVYTLNGFEYLFFTRLEFYRPDVVHIHDLPMLAIGVAYKEKYKVPLIYDAHETYSESGGLSLKLRRLLHKREKKFIKKVDQVIVVNPMQKDLFLERYQIKSINVVQNATKIREGFDRTIRYDKFRSEYPKLLGKNLLLYQGWISDERNLENVIKALPYTTSDKWHFVVMGYGEYQHELAKMARDLGVQERVVFVPAKTQEELLFYSASADLGIIPYSPDRDLNSKMASPNKLYEFGVVGLPILANRLPFVESVLKRGQNGIIVDMSDPHQLANTLNSIGDEKLVELRTNGRNSWHYFDWNEEQKNLFTVYNSINT